MARYVIRRLLQAIPLLLIVSFVLFALMQATGDPLATMGGRQPTRAADRERLARQLGLDQPIHVQYVYWLIGNDWVVVDAETGRTGTRRGILRGDFGVSYATRQPVLEMIGGRVPDTLLLTLTAEVLILTVSLGIGIFSAVRKYSFFDQAFTSISFVLYSVPVFIMAYTLIYAFSIGLRRAGLPYFPTSGIFDPAIGRTFEQVVWHMVLPVLTLSLISIAAYSRYIRSTMLEVISSDYIRTARSKGITERRTLFVHAFKNASLPLITLIGLDLPFLLGGAVVTETIFAWPGMGYLFINSLQRSDYPVLMGILMLIAVGVVISQLIVDLLYTVLDPRIRYS
ncbi:MAG: ABC transporter permease [Anaerolineae bacterium]|jgi:peptide/nickel transport system permease protein|nr:ABC transporter permease [Anaerolineae bacterium]